MPLNLEMGQHALSSVGKKDEEKKGLVSSLKRAFMRRSNSLKSGSLVSSVVPSEKAGQQAASPLQSFSPSEPIPSTSRNGDVHVDVMHAYTRHALSGPIGPSVAASSQTASNSTALPRMQKNAMRPSSGVVPGVSLASPLYADSPTAPSHNDSTGKQTSIASRGIFDRRGSCINLGATESLATGSLEACDTPTERSGLGSSSSHLPHIPGSGNRRHIGSGEVLNGRQHLAEAQRRQLQHQESLGQPGTQASELLAVSRSLPHGMKRTAWCLRDYEITARLYKGASSSVYKATCLHSGVRVALKVYSLDRVPSNLVHTLVREVRIHADLQHRGIIGLYGVFQEGHRLVLVQERAAQGDLYHIHREQLGSRMSEAQLAGVVLAPLLDALAYLHIRGVCHRDIKPENLLVTADGTLRLADFGAAINIAEERAVTRTGTADYMAPEVERCPLKAQPDDNKDNASLAYTTAADIWSVGVLAFEMLCGFPPFASPDPYTDEHCDLLHTEDELLQQALEENAERHRQLHFPHFVSPGARDFITLCLLERSNDRPSAEELLRHPWLRSSVVSHNDKARRAIQAVQGHAAVSRRGYSGV